MMSFAGVGHIWVVVTFTQAAAGPLVNVNWSYKRGPAPSPAGQVFKVPQTLTTPLRPSRPLGCWRSLAVNEPATICAGRLQLGSENENVFVPPVLEVTVSVKLIMLPQ